MRYRLRTLLIVLALGPPVLGWGWRSYNAVKEERERVALEDATLEYKFGPSDYPPHQRPY